MVHAIFHSSTMVFPIQIVSVDHNQHVGVQQQLSKSILFLVYLKNFIIYSFDRNKMWSNCPGML
jgi:hypothetical protein